MDFDEAESLFPSNEERLGFGTDYAKAQGIDIRENGASWWWLRSPGITQTSAGAVYGQGAVNSGGKGFLGWPEIIGVRPVVWIELDGNR